MTEGRRSVWRLGLALVGAALVGGSMAMQTRANGELGQRLDDVSAAALWSFGSGFVIMVVLCALLPSGRRGLARMIAAVRSGELPRWTLFGGVIGGCFVFAQSSISPLLGVALFTVGVVTGQSIGGILTDRFGVGPGGPRPVTWPRLLGAVVMVIAVAWGASSGISASAPIPWLLVPLVIGIGMGWQQAGNGKVRMASGTALMPTLTNFTSGSAFLLIGFLVHLAVAGPPKLVAVPWWSLLGGVIGVVYIGASAILVEQLGVLLLSLGLVAGQVITSLVVDQLLPAAEHTLTVAMVGSAALTVVAVAISAIPDKQVSGRG